ncbi:bifunctional lysylphosphatidylglycerol flippase/synthetase MprF [Gryllotalpicola reticulitermitis]|uniref:Bifunctional lysylphosphatidylglycerol flippase/synthetase MprF n=1 Tax=Gryllotalpicola reticulitermitis TaxID=1184153 RepID=A0ABV8Q8Q1_9MICO
MSESTDARGAGPVRAHLARHPFSTLMVMLYLLVALVTGPFRGPDALLRERFWVVLGTDEPVRHWWTPMTGMLFAGNLPELALAVVGSIVLLGGAEILMGWRRTAFAFVVTALIGVSVGAGLILLGEAGDVSWARSIGRIATVDPQSGIFGAIAAASAFAGPLWRRRIRLLSSLVAIVFVLYAGQPADIYRLVATVAGLGLGLLLPRARRRATWTRSSRHELRTLLAAATALTAVGPVIALFSPTRVGPLGPIGLLLAAPAATPAGPVTRCELFSLTHACVAQLAARRIDGPGPIVVSVVPLLVLLLAAWGLAHGRRFAVWLGAGVNLLLGVLGAVFFGLVPTATGGPSLGGGYRNVQFQLDAVVSILLPFAMAAALLVGRRNFPVRTGTATVVRYLLTTVGAFVALAGLCFAVLTLGHEHVLGAEPTPARLAASTIERFVPVAFLGGDGALVTPTSFGARVLMHVVGPVFWLVAAGAALAPLFGDGVHAPQQDSTRARGLVRRGGDSLAFMTTWAGNEYWFDPRDRNAGVAYRVVGRVALTTGGPIGSPADATATIDGFAHFCDENGWVPVFYSVDAALEAAFDRLGWHSRTVAEEAVLCPATLDFAGRRWQKVRSAVNRANREGIRALWCSPRDLPRHLGRQLAAISEEWVAAKELPEMAFTLGSLAENRDPAVRLMVAIGPNERVEAFTSWLPVYRDGVVVGYTNDLMRRRDGATHGVMEFTIAEVVARLRADGIEQLSLSAAPLARSQQSATDGIDGLLDRLSERLEPVYGFRSLLDFKLKFQPALRPLLMAYPDAVALPAIGLALVRAYLPTLSLRQATQLVRGLAGRDAALTQRVTQRNTVGTGAAEH